MSEQASSEWLCQLPKIELHLHLDGAVKPSTLRELADQQQRPLPASCETEGGLLGCMQVGDNCGSLKEYLSKFDFVLPYLQTAYAIERVAYETVEQFAAENGQYIEVRFAPQLHTEASLTSEQAIAAVLRGLSRGERDYGIIARGIAICMRHHSVEDNLQVVEAAAAYLGRGLVAVDLAGDEASFPPLLHRQVFTEAHKRNIPVTIHAGEAAGADSIYDAVARLGASRIGHGVRARENPQVLKLLRERQIPLEMCPISNIQTKAVPDWQTYPIREYLEQGLVVTVNTDNPTVSGTTLVREFQALVHYFQFNRQEIAAIIINSAKSAFLEPASKQILIAQLQASFIKQNINVSS